MGMAALMKTRVSCDRVGCSTTAGVDVNVVVVLVGMGLKGGPDVVVCDDSSVDEDRRLGIDCPDHRWTTLWMTY